MPDTKALVRGLRDAAVAVGSENEINAVLRYPPDVSKSFPEMLRAESALLAHVEQLEGKAVAWEDIAQRLEEAHRFAQGAGVKYLGRNVWHVALDEAVRLREENARLRTALGQARERTEAIIAKLGPGNPWREFGHSTALEVAEEMRRSLARGSDV